LTPSISVILATHDRPESLRRAVEAVLAQTLGPKELIVVNDGAEDICPAIGQRARAAGVSFHYLRQDRPSLSASRNRGIAAATGDVVLLLDDDVMLSSDHLARLAKLYAADPAGDVGGIGAVLVKSAYGKANAWAWRMLSGAFAINRWGPRVVAARKVVLPTQLSGQLVPARFLSGGGISLRRRVAEATGFEESFAGYAFGEDTEFCFRAGRKWALFLAPQLRARHEVGPGGRPDGAAKGRMYVANMLHTLDHSVERGAGTILLFAYNMLGMIVLYTATAVAALRFRKLAFVGGMIGELARAAASVTRKSLCGS